MTHDSLMTTDAPAPSFLPVALPAQTPVPRRMPDIWYGPPAPAALAARTALAPHVPAGFSGRAGLLLAAGETGSLHAALAFDPSDAPASTELPAADLLVAPMEDEDFAREAQQHLLPLADGRTRTLLDLAQELAAGRPKSIARGGGAGLKLTFRHWNRAMILAMRAPAAQLFALLNTEGRRRGLRPVCFMEWWTGPAPAHDVKHEGMPLSPRTTAKPVIERLIAGWNPAPDPRFSDPRIAALAPRIVQEAADWVVIEKPSGLLSVPGAMGLPDAMTLTAEMIQTELVPVHRLDMDTSGLLVYAKSEFGTKALMAAFREGRVDKRYLARLSRPLDAAAGEAGAVTLPITTNPLDRLRQCCALGGRPAETRWRVLDRDARSTLVELEPVTGRTHQLRLHAAHPLGLDAPIINDPYYGKDGIAAETPDTPLALHAAKLEFPDPATGRRMRFASDAPFAEPQSRTGISDV